MNDNRTYIKGLQLTVTGVCSRGIASIHVNEGGADYDETASCDNQGGFTFNKIYASSSQGDKTLHFAAYDASNNLISGASTTASVRIDNTPPASPVVTTPSSNPYTNSGGSATFTISGTCSSETVTLTGPGGAVITPSSGTWSYDATLVAGASTDYLFYAYDLAGNQSPAVTQTIVYYPALDFKLGGPNPGGTFTSATGHVLEASVFVPSSESTDTTGHGFVLQTGFNFIINSGRAN